MVIKDGESPNESNNADPNEWPYIIKLYTEDFNWYLDDGETLLSKDVLIQKTLDIWSDSGVEGIDDIITDGIEEWFDLIDLD
jgi:hypothetical protein